ncbi:hypothetical protein B0A50_08521 [Salinomyces thailandicus]|uniref:Uncharacterized protein n=1 Tax=Salinomyces thailandicus TaxID=706561 RepID=A0A4U0TJJ3_9PEZI|nr:hypothetical protein B0A50_08521 [Salinomyces thailandica]
MPPRFPLLHILRTARGSNLGGGGSRYKGVRPPADFITTHLKRTALAAQLVSQQSATAVEQHATLLYNISLVGDYATLREISLVSHAWRTLSWPCLLQVVDLSSHNIKGRLTEHECSILPEVYSQHHAKYRPRSLVPRQRDFLRLITAQPALAKHVKSFTWTLVWRDEWTEYDNMPLLDIDLQTWNVFVRLFNVTHLDLASIHEDWYDDISRNNPTRLFPKVTDLRLLG